MREWFTLYLLLSLQLSGYDPLLHLRSPGAKLWATADKALTVPIGGSGTGEEPGDGSDTGTKTGPGTETGTGTMTGEE
jgi:hypothetical protein